MAMNEKQAVELCRTAFAASKHPAFTLARECHQANLDLSFSGLSESEFRDFVESGLSERKLSQDDLDRALYHSVNFRSLSLLSFMVDKGATTAFVPASGYNVFHRCVVADFPEGAAVLTKKFGREGLTALTVISRMTPEMLARRLGRDVSVYLP